MRQEWLDRAIYELTLNYGGWLDERRQARFKNADRDDESALNWASLAVAAWFVAQRDRDASNPVNEYFETAIDKVGLGTGQAALTAVFDKAMLETDTRLTLADGKLTVSNEIIAGLVAYSYNPKPILICDYCGRPHTGRAKSEVCSNSCRVSRSVKRRAA